MTRLEEIAWFAGVFEGEGAVYKRRFVRGKAKNTHIHGGFRVQMTDRDVIEGIRRITGVGAIIERPPSGLGKKTSYAWQVQNRADFGTVADLLRPFLGERRGQQLAEVENEVTWRDVWWRAA